MPAQRDMIFRGLDAIREKLISTKLGDKVFAGEYAVDQYEATPERFSGKCVAVTSLNPNPVRWQRQLHCLTSWHRIGLPVVVVNTEQELQAFSLPTGVTGVACSGVSSLYERPLQRVTSLLSAGAATGMPVLLINSDIEIHGNGDLIESALSSPDRLTIGVRYNHSLDDPRPKAWREPWGLDAFILTPEMIRTIPDAPFAIGKPVWDYWLPHHFRNLGYQFGWIDSPLFYHELHPLGWSHEEWRVGAEYLAATYGVRLGYGSAAFRAGLQKA